MQAASLLLAGEDASEEARWVEFLRLFLHKAGYTAPPVDTLQAFVSLLPRARWRPTPCLYQPPQSGTFFVQANSSGEVTRVGIVGGLQRPQGLSGPVGREWFLVATGDDGRAERIVVAEVAFWLLPPAPSAPPSPKPQAAGG